jgi:hypothetical protein
MVRDDVTGLALTLPESWRVIQPAPVDLLLALDDPTWPEGVFVPTVAATVTEAEGTIAEIVEAESRLWLGTIQTGRILSVEVYYVSGHEGRRVQALYATPAGSVMVASHYFVSGGLRTRIDVSFGAFAHETGIPVAREIVSGFVPPTAVAPLSALGTGERSTFESLIERLGEEK